MESTRGGIDVEEIGPVGGGQTMQGFESEEEDLESYAVFDG